MPDRGSDEAAEVEIARVLGGLMAASHVYRGLLEDSRLVIARLAEDYPPAGLLATSVEVAVAGPGRLGTPRHVEELTSKALRELEA